MFQVYTSEVGFDGTPKAFLAYRFIEPIMPPNSQTRFDRNGRNLITFSFYSQRMEGTILVLQNKVRLMCALNMTSIFALCVLY